VVAATGRSSNEWSSLRSVPTPADVQDPHRDRGVLETLLPVDDVIEFDDAGDVVHVAEIEIGP
jgi:hypothetical protein